MMKVLNNQKYADLKNSAYFVYDIYRRSSPEKADKLLEEFLKKYSTEEEKLIFANTLLFPFDIELYQYLQNKLLSDNNINMACEKFNITREMINQKCQEYVLYHYAKCIDAGLIDHSPIDELPKNFDNNNSDSQKNVNF